MAFIPAGKLSDLPPGALTEVTIGDKQVAVCNVGGQVHALEGVCPHRGGPLGHGALHEKMIVCPWHAWEFDCTTGQNDYDAAVRVATYAVRIEEDEILIDLP
jgi:nitrite reductase/ring-hydroxylating ferredoxin subunit